MSPEPTVQILSKATFGPHRGYGGIACDPAGGYFVSGDTGDPKTCFIQKFNFDGSPASNFGMNGLIMPKRRTLGMDVVGEYLLVAADWGEILLYNTTSGEPKGVIPKAPGTVYVRDVAIDPKSMRAFGVAQGGIFTWGGSAPWQPRFYTFRKLTEQVGQLRSGEGISIDPIKRTVLVTPIPGNELHELHGNGGVKTYPVSTANTDTHLCDSVLSFDGTTLFVSDMIGRKIHVMRRDLDKVIASRQLPPAAATGAKGGADTTTVNPNAQVTWNKSYTEVVQKAREQNKPMIVYFRNGKVPKCTEFEKQVLLTGDFNSRAQNHVLVFEDVADNRLLAYRFGVYRVPHLVILDPKGDTKAEFTWDIDPASLYTAMGQ